MIRNLKVLGLAIVAVLAIGAIGASAASAAEFVAPEGGTFSGDQTTKHLFTPGSGFGEVTCGKAHFEGSSETGKETNPEVEAAYSECDVNVFGTVYTAHVRMNECQYQFSITSGSEDNYSGEAAVVCPEGNVIEVEVTKAGGGKKCLDTIAAQGGLGPVTYTNNTGESPDDLTVTTEIENVKNTTSGGLLNCGIGNGEHANGTYTGSTTIQAFNAAEEAISLTVM